MSEGDLIEKVCCENPSPIYQAQVGQRMAGKPGKAGDGHTVAEALQASDSGLYSKGETLPERIHGTTLK